MATRNWGILALEDGTVYKGLAFGATCTVVGEACFNTSMTGYQEILTDPSYFAQIVTMTATQIGNYGINPEDAESARPQAAGFVVRELSPVTSNWRSRQSLSSYLAEHNIPGISEIDTRALTKRLRVAGAMKACLSTDPAVTPEQAIQKARDWHGLDGIDYVGQVTSKEPYCWDAEGHNSKTFSVVGTQLTPMRPVRKSYRIAAMDFGAKYNILRRLRAHDFDVQVFPANTPSEAIREFDPDGLFLSNGPGDPAAVTYAHKTVSELIQHYPTFGICMGHQILTHAFGAPTFKLKFGHRGGNQPVKNLETGKVSITSQNHGFASTSDELEKRGAVVTEINLNDQTVEGMRHKDLPVFSVQYHPEASPGPHDSDSLFEDFYLLVAKHAG